MTAMPRTRPEPPADGRKARRADPPGMNWRSGRPIWIPGPHLRRAGWASINLKDADGNWLARGHARIMARAIGDDVDRWRAGLPVKRYGPGAAPAIHSPDAAERTLNAAFERFRVSRDWRALSAATRRGYAQDLKRFLARFGAHPPHIVDRPTFSAWWEFEFDRVFALRALGWTEAEWNAAPRTLGPDGAAHVAPVRAARWAAWDENRAQSRNTPGQAQMNAVVRAVSRLYGFIASELNWKPVAENPAERFRTRGLKRRLVVPSDAQLAHLVDTADAMGLHCVGDGLVYLANIGRRPADMVGETLSGMDEGRVQGIVKKTGARVDVKIPRVFFKRLSGIRARRAADTRKLPDRLLVTDASGAPVTREHFHQLFTQVRAEAAKAKGMADVAALAPYDFRKKAITRLAEAGNTRDDISHVTTHSYKTVSDILDAYIVPTREGADAAMKRLDDHLEKKGVKW